MDSTVIPFPFADKPERRSVSCLRDIVDRLDGRNAVPEYDRMRIELTRIAEGNELARRFAEIDGRPLPAGTPFHLGTIKKDRKYWLQAVAAYAVLTGLDLERSLLVVKILERVDRITARRADRFMRSS